jgi:YVTN family beta-propeller protein
MADSTHIMLMKPVEALHYSTVYTLHIAGVTDLKGNALASPYTSTFSTKAPDTNPPYVYDVIPAHGSTQVDVTKPVKVFFSEPMNKTAAESGFRLMTSDSSLVEGDYSWDPANTKMTYTPDFSLEEGTDYILSVSTLVTDLSGNPMEEDTSFTFSTVDVAAPQILYLGPADGSSGISVKTPVVVKVSEPLDLSTITSSSFTLTGPGGQVNGTYEYLDDDRTIVLRPSQALQFNQSYTITLTSAISDISNPKQYLQAATATFQTTASPVVPHILYMEPPFGAIGTKTTLVGSGFDPVPGNNLVWFDGVAAIVTKSTLESATVLVPVGADDGPVTASVKGVAADNSFEFDVVPPNTDPSYSVIASANTGSNTRAVVINPDAGYAYVTNWGDNTVTPLDISGDLPIPQADIPVGVEPMDIDLNPAGTLAYVTNFLSNTVSVIGTNPSDAATFHYVTKDIPVGYHPYGVAVSSDMKVYVANNESEYVSVIDVDPNSGGFDHVIANLKTGSENRGVVVTPDAVLVLVTGDNGVAILDRDPESPTFNDVIARASAGSSTRDVTITPDAALALATTEDGVILIIDIYQPPGTRFGSVIASVKTGSSARNVSISPDAAYVYITNPDENTVSVYQLDYSIVPGYGADLSNPLGLIHLATIEVGDEPYAIAGHPNSEYILVTHDSEAGGVTKIGVKEVSLDVIQTLEDLIASVKEAQHDRVISRLLGAALLFDLGQTLNRVNLDLPLAAILSLDKFIRQVERNMHYGRIPEDLGNAWLETAYRIRAQLLKDAQEKLSSLKGTDESGSGTGTSGEVPSEALRDYQNELVLNLEIRPNPFSTFTQISFDIPELVNRDVPVTMRVYNTSGQMVKTLVQMHMEPGRYTVLWNGDLDQGGQVTNGLYLLELRIPGHRQTLTLSVVK